MARSDPANCKFRMSKVQPSPAVTTQPIPPILGLTRAGLGTVLIVHSEVRPDMLGWGDSPGAQRIPIGPILIGIAPRACTVQGKLLLLPPPAEPIRTAHLPTMTTIKRQFFKKKSQKRREDSKFYGQAPRFHVFKCKIWVNIPRLSPPAIDRPTEEP